MHRPTASLVVIALAVASACSSGGGATATGTGATTAPAGTTTATATPALTSAPATGTAPASATPAASGTAAASGSAGASTTFASERHEYTLVLPEGYGATPADADWAGGLSSRDTGYDTINDADFAYQLRVASQESGDAKDTATWVRAIEKRMAETGCQGSGAAEDIRVGGADARLFTFAPAECSHGNAEILVLAAQHGRGYVMQWVSPSGEEDPKRATLDALLATLTFGGH